MPNDENISLRDYFAGQALAGFIGSNELSADQIRSGKIFEACYSMADKMIKERGKHNG